MEKFISKRVQGLKRIQEEIRVFENFKDKYRHCDVKTLKKMKCPDREDNELDLIQGTLDTEDWLKCFREAIDALIKEKENC
jgi:hypothetical protein